MCKEVLHLDPDYREKEVSDRIRDWSFVQVHDAEMLRQESEMQDAEGVWSRIRATFCRMFCCLSANKDGNLI